ncbi:MAG: DUF4235 domain-containing protein [Nocardiopsaceae bacterium]|nr:DUF4235 domain-containing protein [Nocardiopsaceae bacterium]
MAKNSGGAGGKLVATLATTAAVYAARKVITALWTRTTGKVPPTDPADPEVTVAEALGWAAVAGVTIEAARLFAARATTRRQSAADATDTAEAN